MTSEQLEDILDSQGYGILDGTPIHRSVAKAKNGGRLPKGTYVHHINMIKWDNDIDNLVALDKQGHKRAHVSMNRLVGQLMDYGIIEYLDKTNEYVINNSLITEEMDKNRNQNRKKRLDTWEKNRHSEPSKAIKIEKLDLLGQDKPETNDLTTVILDLFKTRQGEEMSAPQIAGIIGKYRQHISSAVSIPTAKAGGF